MNRVGEMDMGIWESQKKIHFWVGVGVMFLSLMIGVVFYWSKGIVLGVGGFLGLFHAAMGVGLFFGIGVYLVSSNRTKKNGS